MSKITRPNIQSKKIILDLCGGTGAWYKPYKDAVYDVGYKKGYIQAAVDTIDKVFEMSPKQSFVNWKPTDAFRFYERLKAYEKELQQLNKGDNHD